MLEGGWGVGGEGKRPGQLERMHVRYDARFYLSSPKQGSPKEHRDELLAILLGITGSHASTPVPQKLRGDPKLFFRQFSEMKRRGQLLTRCTQWHGGCLSSEDLEVGSEGLGVGSEGPEVRPEGLGIGSEGVNVGSASSRGRS